MLKPASIGLARSPGHQLQSSAQQTARGHHTAAGADRRFAGTCTKKDVVAGNSAQFYERTWPATQRQTATTHMPEYTNSTAGFSSVSPDHPQATCVRLSDIPERLVWRVKLVRA